MNAKRQAARVTRRGLECDISHGIDVGASLFARHRASIASQVDACVRRIDKTLARVLSGDADAGVRFSELTALLRYFGFAERVRGSHHLFVRPGVEELINLQADGSHAKPYQVRQVRSLIRRYGLHSWRQEE